MRFQQMPRGSLFRIQCFPGSRAMLNKGRRAHNQKVWGQTESINTEASQTLEKRIFKWGITWWGLITGHCYCPCPSNADLFKGKRGGKIISGEHTWLVLDRDLVVVVGGEEIVEGAFFVSLDFGRVEWSKKCWMSWIDSCSWTRSPSSL